MLGAVAVLVVQDPPLLEFKLMDISCYGLWVSPIPLC